MKSPLTSGKSVRPGLRGRLALLGGKPVRSRPWPSWPQHGPEVHNAIRRVAESNHYHPQFGRETETFEAIFAEFHRVRYAVATSSGTTALQLALAACGIGFGDEVIVPAYTYIATAAAVVEQTSVPKFVDSEPLSQGLDPVDVVRKINARTRAILAVHCNGYPCDLDRISSIARKHRLMLIEDCSHAHGAIHRNRLVGTIGHAAAFSLHHKKNLSAGLGGVAITNDPGIAERMKAWRSFSFGERVGHNWQISEFHAAIAATVVPDLNRMNAARTRNVADLLSALGEVDGITPLPGLPNTTPVYYNLILQYDADRVGVSRQTFVCALAAEGVPISMFYSPLQRWGIFTAANFFGKGHPFSSQNSFKRRNYPSTQSPVADAICDRINLEFKVQPTSGRSDMEDIAFAIHKIVKSRGELADFERQEMKS